MNKIGSLMLHSLPSELRSDLKEPVGKLIPDRDVSTATLSEAGFLTGGLRVSIGDRITERIIQMGETVELAIIDGIEKRQPRPDYSKNIALSIGSKTHFYADNPPGFLSDEVLEKLRSCLELLTHNKNEKIILEIRGEEDLTALPVLAFYPLNCVVAYGQPNEGVVIAKVTEKSREFAKRILKSMGITDLSRANS